MVLRRASSRALRAASRARAAAIILSTILRATGGFSSKYSRSPSPTTLSTMPLISLLPSLVLVWPSNCGFCILTETIAVSPSRTSSPVTETLSLRVRPSLLGVVRQRARERRAEADQVRAALDGVDVVDEREHRLGVAVVVLERDLDRDVAIAFAREEHRLGVQRLLVLVQVLDELDDAALRTGSRGSCRPARRSASIVRPLLRNASSRMRPASVS